MTHKKPNWIDRYHKIGLKNQVTSKICPICKQVKRRGELQVHHITPICYGGEDFPENVVLVCPECHHRKIHNPYNTKKDNLKYKRILLEFKEMMKNDRKNF